MSQSPTSFPASFYLPAHPPGLIQLGSVVVRKGRPGVRGVVVELPRDVVHAKNGKPIPSVWVAWQVVEGDTLPSNWYKLTDLYLDLVDRTSRGHATEWLGRVLHSIPHTQSVRFVFGWWERKGMYLLKGTGGFGSFEIPATVDQGPPADGPESTIPDGTPVHVVTALLTVCRALADHPLSLSPPRPEVP